MMIDAKDNADIRVLDASELDQTNGGFAGLLVVAIALMGVAAAVYCEGKEAKRCSSAAEQKSERSRRSPSVRTNFDSSRVMRLPEVRLRKVAALQADCAKDHR
jgi:hypothetical protein